MRNGSCCGCRRSATAAGFLLMSGWLEAALKDGLRFGEACGLVHLPLLVKPFRLNELFERIAMMLHVCARCVAAPAQSAGRVRALQRTRTRRR